MASVDNATWQALGLTVTLLGLVATILVWRRRGIASGLRALAWSLLPLAAALTGTLRLGWEVVDAVVDWAVRLVFSPLVWIGLSLATLSALLFVVSGLLRRRAAPRTSTPAAGAASGAASGAAQPRGEVGSGKGKPAVADDDMADIEAILKRHGIG